MPTIPDLVLDTTRYASEKKAGFWETPVCTPYSSTSTMSASLAPDVASDVGSDSLSPGSEIKIKTENAPSPPLQYAQEPSGSPTPHVGRSKPLGARSPSEEHKRIRVNERSKTGCLTCRKRKKKCDETKPYCTNCTKTNYACEGYPSRKQWHLTRRGSRPKTEDDSESDPMLVLSPQPILPTFPAVENEDDHLFLDHYINKTSRILSMNDDEEDNPWTELILPMAKDDQALMHSVLALAGSHLIRTMEIQRLHDRQMFHLDASLSALRRRLGEATPSTPVVGESEAIMASMIFQFLMSKNDASQNVATQSHLKAAREILQAPDTPFWRFAWSFCRYHEFSTTFTSLPGSVARPTFELGPASGLPADAQASTSGLGQNFNVLVGVLDVPFMTLISKITQLRDRVRQRQMFMQNPAVHPWMLPLADELGRDIAHWRSGQPEGTPRYVAAELYRHASRLYLLRTVRAASRPESRRAFATCVAHGLKCLRLLPPEDPVQSGLLLPTLILGCGAFETAHRTELRTALDVIEAYSGFGNVRPVRDILQRVWTTMDAGDIERSWDWETLTQEMGYASLIT